MLPPISKVSLFLRLIFLTQKKRRTPARNAAEIPVETDTPMTADVLREEADCVAEGDGEEWAD